MKNTIIFDKKVDFKQEETLTFFVNENFVENVIDADIYHKVLGSDHCPVSIELDI